LDGIVETDACAAAVEQIRHIERRHELARWPEQHDDQQLPSGKGG